MIGAIVGGLVGAAIAGCCSSGYSARRRHALNTIRHNDIIEYHRWLEQRKKDEMINDEKRISELYEYRRSHCPICGKEIEVERNFSKNVFDYDYSAKIRVHCGCRSFTSTISIPSYDYYDHDIRKKARHCADIGFEHRYNIRSSELRHGFDNKYMLKLFLDVNYPGWHLMRTKFKNVNGHDSLYRMLRIEF